MPTLADDLARRTESLASREGMAPDVASMNVAQVSSFDARASYAGADQLRMNHTPLPTPPPQIVRGRPLRTFFYYMGGCSVGLVGLFALWVWLGHGTSNRRNIATLLALLTLAFLLGLALALAAALTSARVDGAHLRFTFCGIPTRTIPLDAITGYERVRLGRVKLFRILYHSSWTAPSGLLDHDQLEALLRSHGVPKVDAD